MSVGDGIYKSIDAGKTWTHLGLRDGQQIPYILVDPRDANRLYVAVLGHPYGPNEERGVYRSTDGGRTFQNVLSKDENTSASDLEFDPKNPDIVYACLWEAPDNPNIIAMASDQGAIISVNNGETWSSWYNQPTSQMYHVNADDAFPYRVCGGQQESGSACVASRGNDGMITFREWHPVGVD